MQGGTIDRAYERNGNKGGRNLELEKKKERKKNEKTRNQDQRLQGHGTFECGIWCDLGPHSNPGPQMVYLSPGRKITAFMRER